MTLIKRFVFTPLRRAAWKFLGLHTAFAHTHDQIATLRRQIEVPRFFHLRPGTTDLEIFQHVVVANEYDLPDQLQPNDIILDIGTHIGSFCYSCLLRGCGRVYGFEADRANYDAASANLRIFGDKVRLSHGAVWRSDRKGDRLFSYKESASNLGGGSVLFDSGQRVQAIALDDILRDITREGQQRVRLLKIDCEGSEFPILLTSSLLHLIDEIRGEFHEINDGVRNKAPIPPIAMVDGIERFSVTVLADALEKAGFVVQCTRTGDSSLGHFSAIHRLSGLHGRSAAA